MVECDLAKVEVAGSNPVSRSIDSHPKALVARAFCFSGLASEPWTFWAWGANLDSEGAVPKW